MIARTAPRIFVSAGEPSGDLHGAGVVKALRERHPDAVIEGSSIWSSQWKAERASTYGVDEDELPAFYRNRTTLNVNVKPDDVAEAIAFFASERSAKSTGNILNVDGGVPAAYPR